MTLSRFFSCTAAIGLIVCWTVGAKAQSINTTQMLHPTSRCDHVIELIQRYGVNNSVDFSGGLSFGDYSPLGGLGILGPDLGDLEITLVQQIAHQDEACGPRIAVVIRNLSDEKVCDFHVTAVATLGRIFSSSPCATERIVEILPGASLEVQIQLPIEALAMGNLNGQIIGFQRLVVAVDSYDEWVETNEANNIKAWHRSEIPVIGLTIVEEVSEPVSEIVTDTSIVEEIAPAEVLETETLNDPANTFTPIPQSPDAIRSAIEQIDVEQSTIE